jgi:hypothetical protein
MVRVQRVTYEDAYVTVPITEPIITRKEDETFALVAEAIRISRDPLQEVNVVPQDFAVPRICIYVPPLLGSNGPGSEKPSIDSTCA